MPLMIHLGKEMKMDKYKRYFNPWFIGVLALFVAGCGGGGAASSSGSSTSPGTQTGTLSVSLTDAPAAGGFDAVNVTISKVRVHINAAAEENSAGWSEIILDPARKINLLDLQNGVLEDLGETPLAAGHYTQLRLVLVANSGGHLANSVVLSGTTNEIALVTPGSVQSGIKLIHGFDVAADQLVELTLDFDASKSIVKRGNGTYALKPVVSVIPMVVSGGIVGFVSPTLAAGKNPVVTAQLNGEIVKSTVPDPTTGEFRLFPIVQSSTAVRYTVVVTAADRATIVISDVPVIAQQDTIVSTSGNPIAWPVPEAAATYKISGIVTLAPPSSTEVAYVTAKQEIVSGLTAIVIDCAAADANTGAYSLTLPVTAPLRGTYVMGAPLPIALTPQTDAAGTYTVEASAAGYTTDVYLDVLDISAGDLSDVNLTW